MKKLSLAIMLIAQTSLANADFKTLGDRLSSDSILFKTCVDVQSKIQSQTEFNQSERERLLVALKSPGSDKSDNEADLEAAEQELIRLSIEAPKVTLIAGAISDSMAVSLDVNCNTAELEFVVTRYTDAASTIVSKVSSVDTFSPTFTKSLFSVQSDEISMDVNVDGKVSVLFKSGEKLDLKQTYILAMPGGTHEMAGIIQSVQGVK